MGGNLELSTCFQKKKYLQTQWWWRKAGKWVHPFLQYFHIIPFLYLLQLYTDLQSQKCWFLWYDIAPFFRPAPGNESKSDKRIYIWLIYCFFYHQQLVVANCEHRQGIYPNISTVTNVSILLQFPFLNFYYFFYHLNALRVEELT